MIVQWPEQSSSGRQAYNADITYGTNNEFGFDYLRDNLVYDARARWCSAHNFAIVDEVDSILIDEARTPLIISGPTEDKLRLLQGARSTCSCEGADPGQGHLTSTTRSSKNRSC